MSEQMWGVSTGSYSDYRVLCICPTKSDAEEVARKMRGDKDGWRNDADVEAFPLVTGGVEKVEILKLTTTLWDDGSESGASERIDTEWPFDALWDDAVPLIWRWVRAPIHNNKGGRLEVSGTDHERVRKVYSDKRAELRADTMLARREEIKGRR